MTMTQNQFPLGWNEERVSKLLTIYEAQTEEEILAEDEAAWNNLNQTFMQVPKELVPAVLELIAQHQV